MLSPVCYVLICLNYENNCLMRNFVFLIGSFKKIWIWCQKGGNKHQKQLLKFHEDLISGTISRLHLSSKSLPGVKEDKGIPNRPGDGIRWEGTSIKSSWKVLLRSDIMNHVKTLPVHKVSFWSLWWHWHFC